MKTKRSMLSLLFVSQLVIAGGCAAPGLDDDAAGPLPQGAASSGYAENLYSDFSEIADSSVLISVDTTAEGSLAQLEDAPRDLLALIGSPDHAVASTVSATRLHSLRYFDFPEPDAGAVDYLADRLHELEEEEGLSLREGRYRVLAVTTSIDGEARQHGAVEVCWDAQDRCALLDPAMMFAEVQVNGVKERRAAGWAPIVTLSESPEEPAMGSSDEKSGRRVPAASCHIKGEASTVTTKSVSEPGFDQTASSSWKIHVGKLSSSVTCKVVNGACTPVSTNTAETSYAINAPSSSYYQCANIKKALTYSNSPGLVKNLMNTGCAFTYSTALKPSLSFSVSAGQYPFQGKLVTNYYPYVADNFNGLTHQVTCTF